MNLEFSKLQNPTTWEALEEVFFASNVECLKKTPEGKKFLEDIRLKRYAQVCLNRMFEAVCAEYLQRKAAKCAMKYKNERKD